MVVVKGSLCIGPPLALLFQTLDLLTTVQAAPVDTGTLACGLVPGAGAGQVACPEGPGAALIGAHRVDATALGIVLLIEKDTVLVVGLFNDGGTQADASQIASPQLIHGDL